MRILVTGGGGFIGQALVRRLSAEGHDVRMLSWREYTNKKMPALPTDSCLAQSLSQPLEGVDLVVHLAALVDVANKSHETALSLFRTVNSHATECLARACITANVQRLVFLSTIKVNGEETVAKPFSEPDIPCPSGPYALSKWEAEQALWRLSSESELELVVIRSPLVYGPGVKGNMGRLIRLVERGFPLPFGGSANCRSFIGIDNLVDFIMLCTHHPRAAGESFFVSDGQDISTGDLLRLIAKGMGRSLRLFTVPEGLIQGLGKLIGRGDILRRLFGSLQLDSSKAKRLLGWVPARSIEEGIADMMKGRRG